MGFEPTTASGESDSLTTTPRSHISHVTVDRIGYLTLRGTIVGHNMANVAYIHVDHINRMSILTLE